MSEVGYKAGYEVGALFSAAGVNTERLGRKIPRKGRDTRNSLGEHEACSYDICLYHANPFVPILPLMGNLNLKHREIGPELTTSPCAANSLISCNLTVGVVYIFR